eukprot:5077324-Amphidinium_carterae.1
MGCEIGRCQEMNSKQANLNDCNTVAMIAISSLIVLLITVRISTTNATSLSLLGATHPHVLFAARKASAFLPSKASKSARVIGRTSSWSMR